jgi:hypothetical protein
MYPAWIRITLAPRSPGFLHRHERSQRRGAAICSTREFPLRAPFGGCTMVEQLFLFEFIHHLAPTEKALEFVMNPGNPGRRAVACQTWRRFRAAPRREATPAVDACRRERTCATSCRSYKRAAARHDTAHHMARRRATLDRRLERGNPPRQRRLFSHGARPARALSVRCAKRTKRNSRNCARSNTTACAQFYAWRAAAEPTQTAARVRSFTMAVRF